MTGWYRGHLDTDPGNPGGELESGIVSYGTYLTKHSSTGELIWSKSINSYVDPQFLSEDPFPIFFSLDFDPQGNLYLSGEFAYYVDLDPSTSHFILKDEDSGDTGRYNMLVASYNSDGEIRWAETIPGSSTTSSSGNGLVVGSNGTLYITGQFTQSVDFNPGAGIYELTSSGSYDGFLWKFVPGTSPVANTGAPAFIFTGQSVQLDGSVTWDANQDSETLTYYWDLDNDGNFGETGPDALYGDEIGIRPVFSAETILTDTFTRIHLMVLDNEGNFDTIFSDLHIREPHPPTAVLGGPFLVRPGEPSGLNAELSSDVEEDRDFLLFEWDLDNDGIFGETGPSALYGDELGVQTLFIAPENSIGNVYPITLRVTDNDGFVDITTSTVTVIETETAFGFATSTDADYLAVDTDAAGNVYVTGSFTGTVDFDPGPGTTQLTSHGSDDCFVAKMDADGNLLWAVSFGSGFGDRSYSLQSDSSGNVYVGGRFAQTVDFDPGAGTHNITSHGNNDIFSLKLDSDGNFVWAHGIGSTNDDRTYHVEVDGAGNVYSTGHFIGTVDFDPSANESFLTSGTDSDVFVSKYDTNGNLVWVKSFTGPGGNDGEGITVDSSGNVYTAGYFEGTVDFDPGAGLHHLTSNGDYDMFVSKLDSNGNFVWAQHIGGAGRDENGNVELDSNGNVYAYGWFDGLVDFDPGPNVFELDSGVERDRHILAFDNDGHFLFATKLIDDDTARFDSTHLTASGDILVVGGFLENADFDSGPGVTNLNNSGEEDAFVAVYHLPNYLTLDVFHDHLMVLTGTTALNSGTFRTNVGATVNVTASLGNITQNSNGTFNWSYAPGPGDDGIQLVTITATGTNGVETTVEFELEVNSAETFDDGASSLFSPASPAQWSFIGGQYQVDSTDTNGLGISTVPFAGDLLPAFDISAQVTFLSGPDRWTNGFLVFDYKNDNDFKYAGMFAGQNQWVIGHYQGNWGNRQAVVDWDDSGQSIRVNRKYTLHLHIDGNEVKLLVDGLPVASATYAGPVQNGPVGLAAENAVTQFDNFHVAEKVQAGQPQPLPINEDFNDGTADGFYYPLQSNWSVIDTGSNHVFRINNSNNQNLGITYMPLPGDTPAAFEMSVKIKSIQTNSGWQDGFLIFDYKNENDFKYAGMFTGQNQWVIGHYQGNWNNRLAQVDWDDSGRDIESNQFYKLHLHIDGDTVKLSVDGEFITMATFGGNINTGAVGLAADRAFTWFDNFEVAAEVDSGKPMALPYFEDFNDGAVENYYYNNPSLWGFANYGGGKVFRANSSGGQGTALARISIDNESGDPLDISADIRSNPAVSSWADGFIIFDYKGENDFKYAGFFTGQNEWIIGHFQGDWNNRLASVDWDDEGRSINFMQFYHLNVHLDGNEATLEVDGEELLTASFGSNLTQGGVGLASANAFTWFDNFSVQNAPSPAPLADPLFANWEEESGQLFV
ncbi:MAG: SBBP repeat-containing protein [Planctomycetaceae bacterium]|nr:SBBP repeat-containing protein [Planctomycetaceae bacterium]